VRCDEAPRGFASGVEDHDSPPQRANIGLAGDPGSGAHDWITSRWNAFPNHRFVL